jgi:hypothetical protein
MYQPHRIAEEILHLLSLFIWHRSLSCLRPFSKAYRDTPALILYRKILPLATEF